MDPMTRRGLRERWLGCLYGFASARLQGWWKGGGPAGSNFSFVELMCGYFDDLHLDEGLEAAVRSGWMSPDEGRVTADFHRRARSDRRPSDVHEAIFADPAWAAVVESARRAWCDLRAIQDEPEALAVRNDLEDRWGRIAPATETTAMAAGEQAHVVRRGWWVYDGTVRLEIRIVRRSVLPGSGDYEDPPEVAEDREMECFEVLAETTTRDSPRFAGMGVFETMEEAVSSAERVIARGIEWRAGG
jgi:hypothetical protein